MGRFNLLLKRFLFIIKLRIHQIFFFLSISSLVVVFFKIINLDKTFSDISYLNFIFQMIFSINAVFIILFLPSYPIFFIILNEKEFTFLERVVMTILTNLVFYILVGFIGFCSGLLITAFFFYISLILGFFLIIISIFLKEIRTKNYYILKSLNGIGQEISIIQRFSLINYLKKKIPLNACLLIVFIVLICILDLARVSVFVGTDPWLHIFIIKKITELSYIPLSDYLGAMGLQIFGAVIHFFSGVDFIFIPRYFIFYTFSLSALLLYTLFMRIFKNQNLAFFGVFILEFSSLGFSLMMYQFWPAGLALLQCLFILFLLYVRFQQFIRLERPTRKIIVKDMIFYYLIIISVFISSLLTHSLTTIIFLISFLPIYFIYFLKDYKRGSDLILLCFLCLIFFIFNFLNISTGHLNVLTSISLIPWYYILLGSVLGGVTTGLLVWRIRKSILFTTGRFNLAITGVKSRKYKAVEDRIILPFALSIIAFSTLGFFFINTFLFNLNITFIFMVCQLLIFVAFSIWGLILFQKKPRGKPFYIWGIFFILILIGAFSFDILTPQSEGWERVLYLTAPAITIGFISYIYKTIRTNSIRLRRTKTFIIFLISFSLLSSYLYEMATFNAFLLERRDINSIQWYSNYYSKKSIILTEFGWDHAFIYYMYPFEQNNKSIQSNDIIYNTNYLYNYDFFPPQNHFNESGINILKEFKKQYDTNVYLIFSDEYVINLGSNFYGRLTEEEEMEYFELNYINKICSSKSEDGHQIPTYWVI